MPNSLVHVIMYSYFLLSSFENDALRKRLSVVKKHITTVQMVSNTPTRF